MAVLQRPGYKAVIARHDNYEPAIHLRAVAIIDGVSLLVVDWIRHLSPGELLQLYFHIDSTRVALESKTGRVETQDEGMTNLLIVPGEDMSGELLPGRISEFLDHVRPSTRLRLTASQSGETTRAFATVVAPWPVSSDRPSVGTPQIVWKAGQPCCEFQMNGRSHVFEWPPGSH